MKVSSMKVSSIHEFSQDELLVNVPAYQVFWFLFVCHMSGRCGLQMPRAPGANFCAHCSFRVT